jgi:ribosomal protein S18 acetylase RimI-like enzyme
MKIRNIDCQEAIPIRHQVLWPDKDIQFCAIEGDSQALHYGVYIDEHLVCVASIFIVERNARLRKFATLPAYQSRGFGTELIKYIFDDLYSKKVNYFWCDARTSAISFYQKLGLHIEGDEFIKSGQTYFKMSKILTLT